MSNQIWLQYCTCILSEIQFLYSWWVCWVITIFKIISGGKAKPFENSVSYSFFLNSTTLKLHMILSENQWEFWPSSSFRGKRRREPNLAFDKLICHECLCFGLQINHGFGIFLTLMPLIHMEICGFHHKCLQYSVMFHLLTLSLPCYLQKLLVAVL